MESRSRLLAGLDGNVDERLVTGSSLPLQI